MPLKLQRKLVEVPNPDLWFVGPRSDSMVPIPRSSYPIARLGEFKVLDELEGAFNVLLDRAPLALFLHSAFSSEPVW